MVNKLTVENEDKISTVYDLRNPYTSGLAIYDIEGINSPEGEISSSEYTTVDGAIIGNKRSKSRPITIKAYILDPVGENRLNLYKQFKIKSKVNLLFETDFRKGSITGYVVSVDSDRFSQSNGLLSVTIKISCGDAYFSSFNSTKAIDSSEDSVFKFPVEFPNAGLPISNISESGDLLAVNNGDITCGCIITIKTDVNQTEDYVIENKTTGEKFTIEKYAALIPGETMVINSNVGEKSIKVDDIQFLIICSQIQNGLL